MCPLDLTLIFEAAKLVYLIEIGHTKYKLYLFYRFEFLSNLGMLMSNQRFVMCSTQTILAGDSAIFVAR